MKINTQKPTSSVAQNYETGKFKLYSQLNLIAKKVLTSVVSGK